VTYTRDVGDGYYTRFAAYTRSGTSIVELLGVESHSDSFLTVATPTINLPPASLSTSSPVITTPPDLELPWEIWDQKDASLMSPISCMNETAHSRMRYRNGTLPLISDQYESLLCCDSLQSTWTDRSIGFRARGPQLSDLFITRLVNTTYLVGRNTRAVCDGPFTTLCDGVTRAMCSPSVPMPLEIFASTDIQVSTQTKSWSLTTKTVPFPVPSPLCEIPSGDCTRLWDEYLSWQTALNVGRGWFDGDMTEIMNETAPRPYQPYCLRDQLRGCGYCGFSNATVEFIHFAEDADESHLCPAGTATGRPVSSFKPEHVMTARWRGFTLTSPTAYAFYSTMQHDVGCGSNHAKIMLPVIPEEVSTLKQRVWSDNTSTYMTVESFKLDYRHLAYTIIDSFSVPLVPHSAYLEDEKCRFLGDECKTIYDDFQPLIVYKIYPGALRSVDPAWKYCSHQQFIAYDPPIVLKPTAMVLAKPTIHPIAVATTDLRHPFPDLPPGIANDGLARPGIAQVGPYAKQTDPPPPMVSFGSSNTQQADLPGLIVSKISLLTVYASAAEARVGSGETMALGDVPSRSQNRHSNGVQTSKQGSSPPDASPDINFQQREAIFTRSGQAYTAKQLSGAPGRFVLDGSTLSAGGSALTVDGAVVNAFNGGLVIQTSPEHGKGEELKAGSTATTASKQKKKNVGKRVIDVPWDRFSFCLVLYWMVIMYSCSVVLF
jgi:hypothetical protein